MNYGRAETDCKQSHICLVHVWAGNCSLYLSNTSTLRDQNSNTRTSFCQLLQ